MSVTGSTLPKTFLLLGSGELGKEFAIAAKRLGNQVIAVDRYANAPAMQVADEAEVISMLDGDALESIVTKHRPDFIVPEIEAIRTEKLAEFEARGITVIPTAAATHYTMNRDRIRDLAAGELGVRTARYGYAATLAELQAVATEIGFPNVVKPVMSSSGKGQSVVRSPEELTTAWQYATEQGRGDQAKVIVEEFIHFELEITLLTIRQWAGPTLFCPPIGHRQERGDYQESWQPAPIAPELLKQAQSIAQRVTEALGGAGIFGVEFFITPDAAIFSELSPRPHDTGMVTLVSQNLNEFELHLRAILGLPIPEITVYEPAASAAILADRQSDPAESVVYDGLAEALMEPGTDVRLFGKPSTRQYRRMGVALARAESIDQARAKANRVARSVQVNLTGL
ncbi:formate-dependent phosphoribosylglycinamide formyltransferase [Limnothrix redekei]|uniref:Formate-dependent phosphoribosylglycinamide formyltransferase n=1 Tax=Limnothrix redekei LRLZ20PSL1 TaxID=3112953 RepID=A0ABW7CCK5_9CYAN